MDGDNLICFGSFPQSEKAADVAIVGGGECQEGYPTSRCGYYASVFGAYRGLYQGSDGAEYAKISGGGSGRRGFYKIEPLRWRIVRQDGGVAVLLCENVILKMAFDGDSNDYEASGVRRWLNDDFYARAFSGEEKNMILPTRIGVETDIGGVDTYDKVFLLSREEAARCLETLPSVKLSTDYAVATGPTREEEGAQFWWLRTPYRSSRYPTRFAYTVADGEKLVECGVDHVNIGVVPALTLRWNRE